VTERDVSKLERVKKPFPRIRYSEGDRDLARRASPTGSATTLAATEETVISEEFDRPVMIHRYPSAIKAF